MIPTRRLLALLLPAAVPLGFAVAWPPGLLVAGVWLALALALVVLDWLRAPPPSGFQVRRHHEPRLSLGVPNAIRLEVLSGSPYPLRLQLRDEHPPSMAADAAVLHADLLASRQSPLATRTELTYHLVPSQRGQYEFGDLNLRYPGPLGLLLRQTRVEARESVRVYPNLLELRAYDLLARRGALHEVGLRQARVQGRGTEFERLREYAPDDDYRRIHWKATARRGKPITIEYGAERSQNVVVMLDTGRLMAAQVGRLTRLDHALNSALLLAYVAGQRGDRVALLAFADRVSAFVPPTRGRRSFMRVLDALYDLRPQRVEPDFARAFHELAQRQLRRSLVLLFTDLAEPGASAALVAHLTQAARRHLPVCVTISDPVLLAAAAQPADSIQAIYERAVAQRLQAERQEVLARLRQRGVVTLDVPANQLTPSVVNTYLELKARTRL